MKDLNRLILETTRLLAYKLARKEPFFQKTACMDPEIRELYSYVEIVSLICEKLGDKESAKEINDFIKPIIERIGWARWQRTEITDLGLKIGESYKSINLEGEDG